MNDLKLMMCFIVTAFIAGCAGTGDVEDTTLVESHGMKNIEAIAQSKSGSQVTGKIEMVQETGRLRMVALFKGLKPGSSHGFHIHEKGDCSASDASSAGGHFSPNKNPHGAPSNKLHHAGDLGNLTADKKGLASFSRVFTELNIDGKNSFDLRGKAIVLHEKPDDMKSQPSGAAGKRIACAEIPMTES